MDNFEPDFLKAFDDILKADQRTTLFSRTPPEEALREYYKMISSIQLNDSVHNDIKVQFETAKNVLLYSFFAYRLGMVGLKQAFAALELGLRRYVGEKDDPETKKKAKNGLTILLIRAHKQNMFNMNSIRLGLSFEDFLKLIRDFRNKLAHGTHTLFPPYQMIPIINDCALILNQVYDHAKTHNLRHSIDGWE